MGTHRCCSGALLFLRVRGGLGQQDAIASAIDIDRSQAVSAGFGQFPAQIDDSFGVGRKARMLVDTRAIGIGQSRSAGTIWLDGVDLEIIGLHGEQLAVG
jgi:hypothetical protein